MKFKITDGLSLALSSDKTELYVIEVPVATNEPCPTTTPFKAFSLATGITIRMVTELEETLTTTEESADGEEVKKSSKPVYNSYLIIDGGKLPAAMPATAFTYTIDFTNGGWVDIQFNGATSNLAAILLNSPTPKAAETGLSPCNYITSNVTTNLYTVDLSAEKYIQIASAGTTITLATP